MTTAEALPLIDAVRRIAAFAAPPAEAETAEVRVRTAPPPAAPLQRAPPPAVWFDGAYASQVLAGINARRAASGLAPLAFEPSLTRAAESYASTLAAYDWFDHTGPDGSTFGQRVKAAGFTSPVSLGEVIALGGGDWGPGNFVHAWIDSAPHRGVILGAGFTRAGIGCHFERAADGVAVRCVMDLAA